MEDIPLIDREGNPTGEEGGDEETSFTDVDEDFYNQFSRAVESDTLWKSEWPQEQYEAARSKYMTEHGAANIPSWMELPDQQWSNLSYEDPLKTIEGAKERLIELEPNTDLDEIRLSKQDDKIHISFKDTSTRNKGWTNPKPLFNKDGYIRADVKRQTGFKEATRNRMQELEELDRRVAALQEVEDLKQKLFYMDTKVKELNREKEHIIDGHRTERNILNSKVIEMEMEMHNRMVSTEELQKELASTKVKMKVLQKSKDAASKEQQARYDNLEQQMSTISKKLEDTQKEVVKYKQEKEEALDQNKDKDLDDKNRQYSLLTKEGDRLSYDLESAIDKFNQESANWSKTEKTLQRDSEEYQKMSRRVKDLEDELQNKEGLSKAKVAQLEKERDSLKAELEVARREGAPLEQEKQLLGQIRELQSTVEELKQEKQEAEESYMRQNKMYMESLREEADTQERITSILDSRNEAKIKLMGVMKTLEKTQQELAAARSEYDKVVGDLSQTLQQMREQRDQLQRDVNVKEEQIWQFKQAIEDLEQQAEIQRDIINAETKPEEEREAARKELESLQERKAELREKVENLERTLGLTTKEKIKRVLEKAGLGITVAGAMAGIISLILALTNGTGAAVKKLGVAVANLGKKMAAALPGLLGTVLSLVLRTGGELLKFLGNNIWIIVVAVGAVVLKSLTEGRRR